MQYSGGRVYPIFHGYHSTCSQQDPSKKFMKSTSKSLKNRFNFLNGIRIHLHNSLFYPSIRFLFAPYRTDFERCFFGQPIPWDLCSDQIQRARRSCQPFGLWNITSHLCLSYEISLFSWLRVTLYSFSYKSNTSCASFYIIELIFSRSQAGSCIDKYLCTIVINLLVKRKWNFYQQFYRM